MIPAGGLHAAPRTIELAGETDIDGFRRAARRLLAEASPPDTVEWRVAGTDGSLFDAGVEPAQAIAANEPAASAATVPADFMPLLRKALLHREPQRFALAWRLLRRLQIEPALRGDRLDPDWLQLQRMGRAVAHDLHKMTAFVRFRPVERPGLPLLHAAWFEPEHHIVEAVAPFFLRRFPHLHWAILTPRRSVSCERDGLRFGPGAQRADGPAADPGERLWLTYYEHIFNPARLKLATMQREMPRRYWPALPEAALISPLIAAAGERSGRMIDAAPTVAARRLRAAAPPLRHAIAQAPLATLAGPGQPIDRQAEFDATRQAASACTHCPLYRDATQTVFGEGPLGAALMFVGEQPGDREDLLGRPFVGPAGQLFDRALAELGADRAQLYVTNAVKHFKFELRGKRRIHKTPAQQEAAACHDWLERELALVAPQAVVALGATAARSLLGRPVAVLRERGQWLQRADGVRVLVTLHPSALLRMPPQEQETAYRAWLADLALALEPAG